MRPLLFIFFTVVLLSCQSLSAGQTIKPAGEKTVVVEGVGSSKQEALLQAKRAAVEEGIGVMLSSHTEVENFVLKKDKIITQSFGAVTKYTLLKENHKGDTWQVKIKATVSLDSIKANLMALKILLISMDKPRMMVLIQEKNGKNSESTIVDYLRSKKFDLVDPAQAAALMDKKDPFILRAMQGDPVAAARLGAENGAEYILVGKVRKSLMENKLLNTTGMKSGQASLTVKVVNCSNGRIVSSKSATGAAVHVAEEIATGKAAAKAAENLMDNALFEAIVASFQDTVNNGADFEVTITGVKSYRLQKQITRQLKATKNVVTVTKRNFGGGKLSLAVTYKGSADGFCDKVDGSDIGGNSLAVTAVTGNRISMNLEAR
jgi:hypothetical protein